MTEATTTILTACFALAGLGMVLAAALKGWHGWLEVRRLELAGPRPAAEAGGGGMAELIELADLRERVRRLESIAACIDI
ncbi:MAG TPA: hypothetical protein VF727_02710 [Allosphingosinicella sp.]|jgi:hypothetical protein